MPKQSTSIDKKLTLQVILWSVLTGMIFSAVQMVTDYRAEISNFATDTRTMMEGHRPTTALALYNYDNESLRTELQSLIERPGIVGGVIRENSSGFAIEVGVQVTSPQGKVMPGFTEFSVELREPAQYSKSPAVIGHMTLYADQNQMAAGYERRAVTIVLVDIARNVALAIVLIIIFRTKLTGPVKRLTNKLLDIDLMAPGREPLEVEAPLQRTELDDLASKLNDLLSAVTSEMERRKMAETRVRQLNEQLEEKVKARTQELHDSNHNLQASLDQLQKMQGMLLQAQRMASLGHLAAGMAHEINNPVAVVYSNIATLSEYLTELIELAEEYQLAEKEIADMTVRQALESLRASIDYDFVREDAPELVKTSRHSLDRVRNIVNELRTFADVEALEKEPVDLIDVMNETVADAGMDVTGNIHVVNVMQDVPVVECVRSQVKLVFDKILQNAREAMPEGGTVEIAAEISDDDVCVVIKDNGVGMDAADVPNAINPFFTRKEVGAGTGLGLTVAYNLMLNHGGELKIASEKGKGTIVILKFQRDNVLF